MMTIKTTSGRDLKNKDITLDKLVPKEHLVRKLDKAIDLSFIRDKVQHLYSKTGTYSVDPVVLFKIIIVQNIFGIRSMRRTIQEVEVNLAYRWYIGYSLDEPIPHFTTFGKVYKRKFMDTNIFEEIFNEILEELLKSKYVDLENIFVDGTHIKANANNKKSIRLVIEKKSRDYQELLNNEIDLDRKEHKKKSS